MGTVKYTGPMASFHCPTNAEIRSLKVHFSPKQEGTGDPSPSNVRPIVGWDGVEAYQAKKNIGHIMGYSASSTNSPTSSRTPNGAYGNTISTIEPENSVTITQTQWPETSNLSNYRNGYFSIVFDNLEFNRYYDFSCKIINITNNPLNVSLSDIRAAGPGGGKTSPVVNGNNIVFKNMYYRQHPEKLLQNQIDVYYCGMSFTITDIMVTPANMNDEIYESYQGNIIDYEFGTLGKNKLDIGTVSFTRFKKYTLSTPLKPGTYTVSALVTSSDTDDATSLIQFDKGGTIGDGNLYIRLSRNSRDAKTFVLQKECSIIYLYAAANYGTSADDEATWTDVQLELGSTATAYEPYDSKHTVYGGWVDLISGEVCEEWYKIVYDGTIQPSLFPWGSNSQTGYVTALFGETNPAHYIGDEAAKHCICDKAVYSNINYLHDRAYPAVGYYFVTGTYGFGFNFPDAAGTTKESLLTYLAENPYTVIYYLKTPNTYHITPTSLATFLGRNNVWSNADYVEIEYDLYETQNMLDYKRTIIANQPHLESASAAVHHIESAIYAPVKDCKVHFAPVQDLHGYDSAWPAGGGKNIAKPYDNSYVSSTYVSFDYSAANATFRCYGTASASSTHSSPSATNAVNNGATFTLPAGTYTLSIIDGDGANIYAQCVSSTETVLAETTSYTTFTTNESLTVFVRLKVAAAATVDNTVKIQLEKGSSATSYVPYENICPISGWTGLTTYNNSTIIPITFPATKNLYNGTVSTKSQNGVLWTANSDNTITVSGTPTDFSYIITDYVEVPNTGTICISALSETTNIAWDNMILYSEDKQEISRISGGGTGYRTINLDSYEGIKYIKIGWKRNTDNVEVSGTIKPQIEYGTTPTAYEPYGTIYGGYVDLARGEIVQEYEFAADTWEHIKYSSVNSTTGYQYGRLFFKNPVVKSGMSGVNKVSYCNVGKYTWNLTNNATPHFYIDIVDDTEMYAAYVTLLSTTNDNLLITCVAKLITPIIYPLNSQTLKTLRGTNNIWSDANGNIDLSYWTN